MELIPEDTREVAPLEQAGAGLQKGEEMPRRKGPTLLSRGGTACGLISPVRPGRGLSRETPGELSAGGREPGEAFHGW